MRVKTGKYRDYNITKSEWVLDGKTVFYASADNISATLDYDLKRKRISNTKDFQSEKRLSISQNSFQACGKSTLLAKKTHELLPYSQSNTCELSALR